MMKNTLLLCCFVILTLVPSYLVNAQKLIPPVYRPFNLGEITPQGWLRDQLTIQGDGLSGHLSLFWPSINESAWIGFEGGDSFERVPYWLNGLIPLAYLLNDTDLINQGFRYVDYILTHQNATGWLGSTVSMDPWPRFPLCLALIQYAQVNATDAPRVVNALYRYLNFLNTLIQSQSLSSWAQYRYQDMILTVHWLYDFYPIWNGEDQSYFLLELASLLKTQGFDWETFYESTDFPKEECVGDCINLNTHGVNNGQAIKSAAVWYRQSGNNSLINNTYWRIHMIDDYHGQASGIFGCDEHLSGNMPSHGSELCTVVETMYSFEVLLSVFGDSQFAERVEKLAFNSLPATFRPDMWSHQYLQQGNEINSEHLENYIWTSDGPDSNIYGLQPNFGCCTANFNQGFPKFTTHLYMLSTQDNGIAVLLYSPSILKTTLSGFPVSINLTTLYPFDSVLNFDIETKISFPFHMRVPDWAVNPTIQINGGKKESINPGQIIVTKISEGKTNILLQFPMEFNVERRYNQAATIHYGPFVMALNMGENWKKLRQYNFSSADWQCLPTQNWNYAILINDTHPENYLKLVTNPMGHYPFSVEGTPFSVLVQGRLINWSIYNSSAMAPPPSPISGNQTMPLTTLEMYPFGATKLRIVEIPTLELA